MAGHNGFRPIPDHCAVDIPIRAVPLFYGKRIHRSQQMLVSVIYSVTGKMLYGYSDSILLTSLHVGQRHAFYTLRI